MPNLAPTPTAESLKTMSLSAIARLIRIHWAKPYFGAKPYLEAMGCLESINDPYGMDSGRSIVVYGLSNMSGFKGECARLIKAELNRRLKTK